MRQNALFRSGFGANPFFEANATKKEMTRKNRTPTTRYVFWGFDATSPHYQLLRGHIINSWVAETWPHY